MSEQLLDEGFYAQGIRHPSVPEGSARLRLTPMATHREDEVDALVAEYNTARDEYYEKRRAAETDEERARIKERLGRLEATAGESQFDALEEALVDLHAAVKAEPKTG